MNQPTDEYWASGCKWYSARSGVQAQHVCETRDVFQARLEGHLRHLLRAGVSVTNASLSIAILGELGGNGFDHNLGQWPDQPGCWFETGEDEDGRHWGLIADRGRGVLSSLRRVAPQANNEADALQIAFHQTLSGRSPEKRGNGLKFVRQTVVSRDWGLVYFSGGAEFVCGSPDPRPPLCSGSGVFAWLTWVAR